MCLPIKPRINNVAKLDHFGTSFRIWTYELQVYKYKAHNRIHTESKTYIDTGLYTKEPDTRNGSIGRAFAHGNKMRAKKSRLKMFEPDEIDFNRVFLVYSRRS